METRKSIPTEIAAEVLFLSNRTCCVCNRRGRPVQIHHIDEVPSNNELENLAVLCLDCHRDTQIRGGFDRKLDDAQVRRYRDDWHRRVSLRRKSYHERPLQDTHSLEPPQIDLYRSKGDLPTDFDPARGIRLLSLIQSLPARRRAAYHKAQILWDTGVTAVMVDGNTEVINTHREILIELARFYPEASFSKTGAAEYFESTIQDLARWHRDLVEPEGPGTGGTIVYIMTGGEVISSLEQMIADMVQALTNGRDDFNFYAWRSFWTDAFEIRRVDGRYGREG